MKNTKNKVIAILCVAVCILTIGYAAFSTIITIEGTANITSEWKVVFTKIEALSKTSGVNIKEESVEGTTATFDVGLTSPGDKIIYEITVENQGTLDAIINDIRISETGNEYIIFNVENITEGSILVAKASTTFNVIIEYSSNVTEQPDNLINKLTIEVDYTQNLGQTPGTPGGETGSNVTLVQKLQSQIASAQSDATVDLGYTSEGCRFDSDSGSVICNDNKKSNGLYYTNTRTENNKTVYYYRGAVNNNYVKFGKTSGCAYNNEPVMYITNIVTQETAIPTEDNCKITNICDAGAVVKQMFGKEYRYVIGVDAATCAYLGGTPLNETATYGTNNIDILWRIVRTNEDGSVRLITEHVVDYLTEFRSGDNAYVGYMFGEIEATGNSAYEATHANNNDSYVKELIDNWYINKTNLVNYANLMSTTAGFCNDRSVAPAANTWFDGDTALGYGNNTTYYGATNRLINVVSGGLWEAKENPKPQFVCPRTNDLFTLKSSSVGNKALNYPVGLITIDEITYAGASYDAPNRNFYLQGLGMETMSPNWYSVNGGYMWNLANNSYRWNWSGFGVFPVININSNAIVTGGTGISTDPYVIS